MAIAARLKRFEIGHSSASIFLVCSANEQRLKAGRPALHHKLLDKPGIECCVGHPPRFEQRSLTQGSVYN